MKTAFVALLLGAVGPALAQTQPAPGTPRVPDLSRPGPWDNDVRVYRIALGGEPELLATFERAGVPTVARMRDGRLIAAFQSFPQDDRRHFDRVAGCFSRDEGRTWTKPEPIVVEGMEGGLARPFDPTLVPLPDGRVRLYFTSNRNADFRLSTPQIYSAISTDGMHFAFEPGVRFGLAGRVVIDCAAALHQGVFHLIAPDNGAAADFMAGPQPGGQPVGGNGYHAVSRDGLTFERIADVKLSSASNRWLGNLQSDGGKLVFFGTGPGTWPVTSKDGAAWETAAAFPRVPGADPGAVKLRDDSWLLLVTSEPRPGTPSALQRGNQRGQPPGKRDLGNRPPAAEGPGPGAFAGRQEIRVERIDSNYKTAPGGKSGSFVTGQEADLMLGGFGFNQSGGAQVFNHPTGLASDGKALLMTDRWNNRVLIWKSAPANNSPPDLVLGQPDFSQNNPGSGRHQLNWPGNVAVTPDGQRVAVTDTNNDRVLIWTSFPTRNGQPADLVLNLASVSAPPAAPAQPSGPGAMRPHSGGMSFGWPWGVWTDGKKLAAVATHGSAVLIWNSLPNRDNQVPDLVLQPDGAGTPRNVTSDGASFFAVSDHNFGDNSRPATLVWNAFPTSAKQPPDWLWREWVKGAVIPGGGLAIAGSRSVFLFDKPPRDGETDANVSLRPATYRNGDGPDVAVANGRLYVCTYNGNHILGWNSLPTRGNQPPDFALGSERTDQDTWAENFFIQNPVVATDGKSLLATSDFDRKMFVWRKLPDESGAKPDLVLHLPEGPWDSELHGSMLALAGRNTVLIWKQLPLDGRQPDAVLRGRIGSVALGELTGVAFDDKHFYLSDRRSESISVWEGIPTEGSEPKFTLAMRSPGRLTSDGNYLCAAPFEGSTIQLWRVDGLGSRPEPVTLGGRGQFNLPSECLLAGGRLFVCNRSFNRVDVWNRVEDALAGRPADALLGASNERDWMPAIGRNKLFMPGSLAWGDGYLWVGEFKFSTRILRFTPQPREP